MHSSHITKLKEPHSTHLQGLSNYGDYTEKECLLDENMIYQMVLFSVCICCSFFDNELKSLLLEQPMY